MVSNSAFFFTYEFPRELNHMRSRRTVSRAIVVSLFLFSALMLLIAASAPAFAQTAAVRDPAEPQQKGEKPKILPRPAGSIARASIDEKSMRALIARSWWRAGRG